VPAKLDVRQDLPVNRDVPGVDGATCGVLGEVCCAGNTCTEANTSCQGGGAGRCRACGGAGEVCCEGSACSAGGCCMTAGGGTQCVSAGTSCGTNLGVCYASACVTDAGSCGGVNDPCCRAGGLGAGTCTASGTVCQGAAGANPGTCKACGRAGEACCTGGTCTAAGTSCTGGGIGGGGGTCEVCGGENQACCGGGGLGGGGTCDTGFSCEAADGGEACRPCGVLGSACCGTGGNRTCLTSALICVTAGGLGGTSQCEAWGGSTERCCAAAPRCNTGLTCGGGGNPRCN
jgi:hypothetical protein